MLYVTTRSRREFYPALRPLGRDQGPDGGLYTPGTLPVFAPEEIDGLKELDFGHCAAEVLNRLFSPGLSGLDVSFTVGRQPVKLTGMNHRIAIAECWHNPHWNFEWAVHELTQKLRAPCQQSETVTDWAAIAVRIAVLFGVFGELARRNLADRERPVDVAVAAGDFTAPMAAWYAREMGLPVNCVICCSADSSAAWDLLHRGELRTDKAAIGEEAAGPDTVPRGLERLIAGRLGTEEVEKYLHICRRNGIYAPKPEQFEILRQGMYAAVVSPRRADQVIAGVCRTNDYLMAPETALIYAGLQDYRAAAGEGRTALMLAEQNPADHQPQLEMATGLSARELRSRLEQI